MQITTRIPPAFEKLWSSDQRYKVLYGGRGGGKTWQVADYLVISMINEPKSIPHFYYLCLRKTMESLKVSSKPTIMRSINKLGLNNFFYTTSTSNEIKCTINGGSFLFRGCKNEDEAEGLKSTENIKKAWYEEARNITEPIWNLLTPTIRMNDSEIILTFNPIRKTDYIYDRFVVNSDPLAEVIKVNYYDNTFFFDNKALISEMQASKRFPELFRRVWLGEPGFIENQIIKPEWWRYYDNLESAINACTGMFITADTAYKTGTLNDYTVLQAWGYNQGHQLFLLKQVRAKLEFPDLVERTKHFTLQMMSYSSKIKPSRIYIEDKVSGISLVQTLSRIGLNVIPWKPRDYAFPDDKVGRANEAALIISTGCVYLPRYEPWVGDFVTEHSEFSEDYKDSGLHDDQVDGTTMALSVWRSMGGGYMKLGTKT